MFTSEKLVDVTIKTKDGREIKAHNFILSRLEHFDKMMNVHKMKESREEVIHIEDFDYDLVKEMIRYLYCDEIPKIKEMALDLLVAGDKYNIQGLVDDCTDHLMQNFTLENFAEILILADKLNMKMLKESTIKFIFDNFKNVFETNAWMQLKEPKEDEDEFIKEQCNRLCKEVMEIYIRKLFDSYYY